MKLKLVHILTEIESPREIESIKSLSPLINLGIDYIQQINVRYTGEDWRNQKAITQSVFTNHGPGHYGAFQSFKKAIQENFSEDIDALILCECDCVLTVEHQNFINSLMRGVDFCNQNELKYLSLGSRFIGEFLQSPVHEEINSHSEFYVTNKIILAHCVVLPKSSREYVLEALEKYSWDTPDYWFNEIFWAGGIYRFGVIRERLAIQHEGISLIDNCWKNFQ